jgi:hypothetical protein
LLVQNFLYWSTQSDTSLSLFRLALQYLSRPCWVIIIRPHSVRIFMCLDTAGLLIVKLSATAFRFKDCCDKRLMISLRVGSAMAWKTSLLMGVI